MCPTQARPAKQPWEAPPKVWRRFASDETNKALWKRVNQIITSVNGNLKSARGKGKVMLMTKDEVCFSLPPAPPWHA